MFTGDRSRRLTLVAATAILSVAVLRANQPDDSDQLKHLSLEELGNLEITSVSKAPADVWQTPAAVYVLTEEDIRRSGATSLPELLRLVPGVQVSRIDADHWAVGVRGFANQFSQSLLVLVDGRSVYTPLFAGVYWSVQDVPLADIDRIEVVRGPGGTIWGTNAVNGVIDIITKRADETQGALASVTAGSLDHDVVAGRYGGHAGRALDYRVAGQTSSRGPEIHPGDDAFDDWTLSQATARADWDAPDDRDTVTVDGRWYSGREGKLTGIGFYDPPAQIDVDDPQYVSGGDVRAFWRRVIDAGDDVQAQVYVDRTNRYGVQFGELRDTIDLDVIDHVTLAARHGIRWGAGARWSPSRFLQTQPTVDFEPHQDTDRLFSLFGQDEISLVPRHLMVTVGSKFEHNDDTGWEAEPSIRGLWMASPTASVWGAVSRAVRIPSRIDRDLAITGFVQADPLTFVRIVGTPTFEAERLVSTEAGYRSLVGRGVYVDVSVFHNVYTGLNGFGNIAVLSEDTPAPATVYQVPYVNAVDGTTDGFEIAPSLAPTPWWDIKAGYSYLHANLTSIPGVGLPTDAAADAGESPAHQFFAQSTLTVGRAELTTTVRGASALAAENVPRYWTADARIGWQIAPHFELSLVGENLAAPSHAEFSSDAGLVGIRRTIMVNAVWSHATP